MTEKYNDEFLLENFKTLGAAIVIRAVRDYEIYANTNFGTTEANKSELEQFFKSEWCLYLVNACCDINLDSKDILPTLQRFLSEKKNKEKLDYELTKLTFQEEQEQTMDEDMEIEI